MEMFALEARELGFLAAVVLVAVVDRQKRMEVKNYFLPPPPPPANGNWRRGSNSPGNIAGFGTPNVQLAEGAGIFSPPNPILIGRAWWGDRDLAKYRMHGLTFAMPSKWKGRQKRWMPRFLFLTYPLELGAVYQTPIWSRRDFNFNSLLVKMIIRF